MGTRRSFTPEFKRESASLVLDQQYAIKGACEAMGVGETGMRLFKQINAAGSDEG